MKILDNQKILDQYNTSKVADTIKLIPYQVLQSWQDVKNVKFPDSYKGFSNIVICGMGGSNLFSELIRDIFKDQIKSPIILVRNYNLPNFADKNSLIIISSYSGNTEETLSCLKQAHKNKLKVICLSSGGKIINFAKKNNIPFYQINKESNPSNQPRYGLCLQLGSALGIFKKLGIIRIKDEDILLAVDYLEKINKNFNLDIDSSKNLAKDLALKMKGRLPIIIGSEFLRANAHILANQINESAKVLAIPFVIPELNHHLMEGLELPKEINKKISFLFFNSDQYSKNITKRFTVTQKVLKKQGVNFVDYLISGEDKLTMSLEILLFSSWLSFYLAVLNEKIPNEIPWVDYFKVELKK